MNFERVDRSLQTDEPAKPARPDRRRRRVGALGRRTFASLRKHRNYRLYFFGQVVSVSGNWMQNVALAWFVIELTHSPFAVGLLVFCRFVPFTALGLVSGVLADRFDNRRMLASTQASAMVVSLGLAALAFSGRAELWLVYVLATLGGLAMVFDAPNRHAFTFRLVGRDELPNAVALNASLFNASRIIGPAIAGVTIAAVGVGACFAINAVSFLAVLAALAAMREDELFPLDRGEARPTVVRGVREVLAYAGRSPSVRTVLLITAVLSTVGFNFHVLVPLVATDTVDVGPKGFGLLSASFGAGALTGALVSATRARASWRMLIGATMGFSVSVLALAPQHTPAAAALFLFTTGVFFTLEGSNSQSILQLSAPDHLRGRVISLYLFSFGGLAPLGGLLAGSLAESGGTELAFGVAGVVGLAMAGVAVAARPRVAGLTGGARTWP